MMGKSTIQYANKRLYSVDTNAPDILLKKIGELQKTLEVAKTNSIKNQKAIEFYEGILSAMKFAWAYMQDLEWIHHRHKILENENEFLKDYAEKLKNDLLRYKIVEEMKLTGDFEEVVKAVDNFIKNTSSEA